MREKKGLKLPGFVLAAVLALILLTAVTVSPAAVYNASLSPTAVDDNLNLHTPTTWGDAFGADFPEYAYDDDSSTYATLQNNEDTCDFKDFGTFNIPSDATVISVTVSFTGYNEARAEYTGSAPYRDLTVKIAPDGSTFGTAKTADLTTADTGITLTWDGSGYASGVWTADNFNNNLQVRIASIDAANTTAYLTDLQVTICYTTLYSSASGQGYDDNTNLPGYENNIGADNPEYAYDADSSTYATWRNDEDTCDFKGFDLNIPDNATFGAVTVSFKGYNETRTGYHSGSPVRDLLVYIAPDGTNFSAAKTADLTTTEDTYILTWTWSSGDTDWTPENFNNNLQVRIVSTASSNTTAYLTDLTVTVAYSAPIPGIGAVNYSGNYDGSPHTVTVTGTQSGDTITYGTATGTYDLSAAPEYTDAGHYTVYYKVSRTNYEDFEGSATVDIAQINLSVTADNLFIAYGDALPVLTSAATGLTGSDTLASLGITLSTAADATSGAGSYPITVSGPASLTNYIPTYTNGVLTIQPKDIAAYAIDPIPAQYYTGIAVTPPVTIPGLTEGTDYSVSYANNINAGTASATATGIGNYNGFVAASFTITYYTYVPPAGSSPSGGSGNDSNSGGGEASIAGDIELLVTFDGNRDLLTANLPGASFDYESLMQEIIETAQSLQDAGYIATVNLNVPDADSPFEFTMNGAQLRELSNATDALLNITSPIGSIRFDADALESLVNQAGTSDMTIKISEVPGSELAASYPDYAGPPVYDISVWVGATRITSFGGGEVTVTIPYTPTQYELENGIVVYYLSEDGPVMVTNCLYDAEAGTVSFVTDHLSLYAVGYNDLGEDLTGWYAVYANYLASRGILELDAFIPSQDITRAEFVTILAQIDGADLSGYTASSFNDVKRTDAYFGAVEWASANGIILGYNGNFSPSDSITRQDICTILMRYAALVDFTLPQKADAALFTDDALIASYAYEAVAGMQQADILSGFPDGSFSPTSNTTQAEAAKIFTIFMQLMIEY